MINNMKKLTFVASFFIFLISIVGCSVYAPQNPYEVSTGHYAGYEWAKDNFEDWMSEYAETGNVHECSGNSESFIEGCNEYIRQSARENDPPVFIGR
jgi:hypothetical protein